MFLPDWLGLLEKKVIREEKNAVAEVIAKNVISGAKVTKKMAKLGLKC